MILELLYNTIAGRLILKLLVNPKLSEICGKFMDSGISLLFIKPFALINHIHFEEYQCEGFHCFNDFFSRKIKTELRPINDNPESLIAPCDGMLSAYKLDKDIVIPVKQSVYSIPELLHDRKLAREFEDGWCLVYRLGVNNYHRYCYFDNGISLGNRHIDGVLHTVRPVALHKVPVFIRNTREYSLIRTESFKEAVQMEVGALLVGKIVNLRGKHKCLRGEEKGFFKYGGSTVIVLLKKDTANVFPEIITATKHGIEVPVKMGQIVGRAVE